uniref:Uncharacterized protein n=1 Tax=Cyprinus carpio TaxID=7962 RepID=A0A8C2HCA3_CYPCA
MALTPTEFDFDEEQMMTPRNSLLSRRRTPAVFLQGPRLALRSVLSDMKRHRRMEEQILRTGGDLFQSDEALEKPSSPHSHGDVWYSAQTKSYRNHIFL